MRIAMWICWRNLCMKGLYFYCWKCYEIAYPGFNNLCNNALSSNRDTINSCG